MNLSKSPLTTPRLIIVGALLVTAALSFVGCSSSGHDHSSHSHVSHSHGVDQYYPKGTAYPLTKCLVSDEAFEHGKPYSFVHKGQEIKLCCKDCLADFKKEPSKYLSKLNAPK